MENTLAMTTKEMKTVSMTMKGHLWPPRVCNSFLQKTTTLLEIKLFIINVFAK